MIRHVSASVAVECASSQAGLVEGVIAALGVAGHVSAGVAVKNVQVRWGLSARVIEGVVAASGMIGHVAAGVAVEKVEGVKAAHRQGVIAACGLAGHVASGVAV